MIAFRELVGTTWLLRGSGDLDLQQGVWIDVISMKRIPGFSVAFGGLMVILFGSMH